MTLQSYKTMYESCLHFGLRFALHNQKRSLDLEVEKEGMALQQEDLRRRHFQLTKLHEATLGQAFPPIFILSFFSILFRHSVVMLSLSYSQYVENVTHI